MSQADLRSGFWGRTHDLKGDAGCIVDGDHWLGLPECQRKALQNNLHMQGWSVSKRALYRATNNLRHILYRLQLLQQSWGAMYAGSHQCWLRGRQNGLGCNSARLLGALHRL